MPRPPPRSRWPSGGTQEVGRYTDRPIAFALLLGLYGAQHLGSTETEVGQCAAHLHPGCGFLPCYRRRVYARKPDRAAGGSVAARHRQPLPRSSSLFYLGFEDIANLTEDVRDPARDLPRAVFFSIGITTLLCRHTGRAVMARSGKLRGLTVTTPPGAFPRCRPGLRWPKRCRGSRLPAGTASQRRQNSPPRYSRGCAQR